MRALSRIFLLLGAFLVVTGVGYAIHSGEYEGVTLMVTTAGCALLVGSSMFRSLRGTNVTAAADDHDLPVGQAEPHVGPTIWPLVLSISTVGLVVGAVTSPWALVVGGGVLTLAAVGWLLDVHHQWLHHYRPAAHTAAAALSHVERKK